MKGFCAIIAGTEGVGKTSLCAEFPKPVVCFSIKESGFEDLMDLEEIDAKHHENINVENWTELVQKIKNCKASTIIVDSLSGLQRILFEHVCVTDYGGDFDKFMDYWKGPRQTAPPYADTLCTLLENKRREGSHVLVISHVKDEVQRNPRGLDYNKTDFDIDEGIRSVFKKWAANIFFLTLDPSVAQVTKMQNKKATEAKMEDEDIRVIFTQKSLVHVAKNKLKLPTLIPMGKTSEEAYDNLVNKLPPLFKEQLIQ